MKAYISAIAAVLFGICANAQDVKVDPSTLPKDALKFLTQHFTDSGISRVTGDNDGSFEVKLTNGTEIEFNKNGAWHEVDGKGASIPSSYLPVNIMEYVTANYAAATVTKIEHGTRGYEIDLNNGTELEFDSNGKFLRIDR